MAAVNLIGSYNYAFVAEGLLPVMGDRVQLQQVMMNLMINGIDAMKDVDGMRELAIKSQQAEHEEIVVSVTDSGVGLPSHQAEQIFNAFFTTKPHGTGMGLRISRSIIESHGGRLWAASNSRAAQGFVSPYPPKPRQRNETPKRYHAPFVIDDDAVVRAPAQEARDPAMGSNIGPIL
jgi:signal transduction histidine kinase